MAKNQIVFLKIKKGTVVEFTKKNNSVEVSFQIDDEQNSCLVNNTNIKDLVQHIQNIYSRSRKNERPYILKLAASQSGKSEKYEVVYQDPNSINLDECDPNSFHLQK